MHRILIAIVAACGGAAPRAEPTPPPPPPPPPQSCPGQFVDDVSGGVVRADGSSYHDTTCRDFPAQCTSTPTCECMKQIGYSMCSIDAKGQVTIIEARPSAQPRGSRE